MTDYDYWQKQGVTPLYPEVDLEEPEQRRLAGRILIIGGNKNAFFTVANAMSVANRIGAGEVRVLMPDSVKGQVPSTPEVYFAPAEKGSGGFGKDALPEILIQADWADAVVLIGDVGGDFYVIDYVAIAKDDADYVLSKNNYLVDADKPIG